MTEEIPIIPPYQITGKIFETSRSLIYRGQKVTGEQNSPVIVKVLKNEYPSFAELLQYRNQYIVTKNLSLPGIVRTYGLERYRHGYALIMEDFGGISLEQWLEITGSLGDNQDGLRVFLEIALQIAQILGMLTQNQIIHQDIKLQNLLINPETRQVKLTDFCLASVLPREQPELKSPYVLEGTLAYMSPEQTGRMNRAIDYRTDFYSTGICFYKLLTGRLPFESLDPLELVHSHLARTPLALREIIPSLPQVINDIVLKLMSKMPEERYQSPLGLQNDLEKCWQQLQSQGNISYFQIGQNDICDHFVISEKLYGRETEVQMLLKAFERVRMGANELVLITGFSGIGKTAVVNEIHKPIVREKGYFIRGKFEQFRRNIPFSAYLQALSQLIEQILCESDETLAQWRIKIQQALGENGQVIVELVPELERIIGAQPAVPEILGSAAQNRFNSVFLKFISVFTTKEHPLVIFLDDLQWADSASLKLMQLLLTQNETGYLLIIGAYRDNEVFPSHPLILTLAEMEKKQASLNTVTLAPLPINSLNQLVADTIFCSAAAAYPLTQLVQIKTKGNPFFVTQFLRALHQDDLITFNREDGCWQSNLSEIKALAIDENIVNFMSAQLQKLPKKTQDTLQLAAYLGSHFDLATMAIVSEHEQEEIAGDLWIALQQGFILPTSDIYKFYQGENREKNWEGLTTDHTASYKFLHDRIQQAAYVLVPDSEKPARHLKIGRLLLEHSQGEALSEQIFAITNHLNLGSSLLSQTEERIGLAQLNLMAGCKAKAGTAYDVALDYFCRGIQLLPADCWQQTYQLSLSLYENAAEAASLTGAFALMEQMGATLLHNTHRLIEQVKVYEVKIQAHTAQNQLAKAIETAIFVLKQVGIDLPYPPTPEDYGQNQRIVREKMSCYSLDELVNASLMIDEDKLVAMRILASVASAAYIGMPALYPLIVLKQVELSLDYGNARASAYAYATYGLILCAFEGDIQGGNRAGELALQLLERFQAKEFSAKVLNLVYPFVKQWQYPLRGCLEPLILGYEEGIEMGDTEFAAYCAYNYCKLSYYSGLSLSEVSRRFSTYAHGIEGLKQTTALNFHQICHQAVLNWLGESSHPCDLIGSAYDEREKLLEHQGANDTYALGSFYVNKLILSFCFDSPQTPKVATIAQEYVAGVAGAFESGLFSFYDALTALSYGSSPEEKMAQVSRKRKTLEGLAQAAPSNFSHKVNLVLAEVARVLDDKTNAINYYDLAIAQAKENKYLHEEGLANELAAKFYLEWGKEKIAQAYLVEAYYCYAHWGAKAKTDALEKKYPQLLQPVLTQRGNLQQNQTNPRPDIFSSSSSSIHSLDLAAVIKASQLISAELVPEHLIFTLMDIVIENAGAQKASLILLEGEQLLCVASCHIVDGCQSKKTPLTECQHLPISCINYVFHTAQVLVIDDMRLHNTFAFDPYIILQQPQSVLCLPLIKQNQPIGILYLENNLTTGAFTRDRIEILKVLCGQAAISFENANLYKNLEKNNQSLQELLENLEQTQSELIKATEKLQYDAFHDSLTQLPNRPWLINLLEHRIQLSQLHDNYLYAVLLIDIDRFKIINDSLGHAIGDEFLKNVAKRLQNCIRRPDTLARFGGDEFAILLEELSRPDEAIEVAEKIQRSFSKPFNLDGYEVFTSASIGIALGSIHYQQGINLIRDADTAMYHAKAQGKNRYSVFTPAMQTQISKRLQLEGELRRAIENQEFCLYYQPIISLETSRLRGFEALVRWNHPQRGRVSPMEFIPIAEETGLIAPLGWWILEQACHQLNLWLREFPQTPPIIMNVNLSAIQLHERDLLEKLEKVLQKTAIPRDCLKLEITESCILETFSAQAKRLKELKDLGIRLSIDDFGTGYSSLSRLHEFPIDTLKIDRSFVHRLNSTSKETIQMIVSLAHSLGMDVVAEGIETTSELQILRELGCDFGQGYLFSAPIDAQSVIDWLNQ